jgi:hypothetical protein
MGVITPTKPDPVTEAALSRALNDELADQGFVVARLDKLITWAHRLDVGPTSAPGLLRRRNDPLLDSRYGLDRLASRRCRARVRPTS